MFGTVSISASTKIEDDVLALNLVEKIGNACIHGSVVYARIRVLEREMKGKFKRGKGEEGLEAYRRGKIRVFAACVCSISGRGIDPMGSCNLVIF